MDSDSSDPLAARLTALDIPVPATLVPRVLAAHAAGVRPRKRHRRTVLATAFALVAVVMGNLGASYLSPRYAQALADVPGAGSLTGPILQRAGLATAGAASLDVRATASGYTLHLFGAYADTVRTTLFVQILGLDGKEAPDGTAPADFSSTTLTDQFGHTYHLMNGFGLPVLHFEPLTGAAASLGARLILHVESLTSSAGASATSPSAGTPVATAAASTAATTITGPWNLAFTLSSTGGQDLALPPPVHLGDTTYTFTAVRTTSTLLEVSWTITGGAIARQQELAQETGSHLRDGGSLPLDLASRQKANYDEIATSKLLDSSGKAVEPIYGSGQSLPQNGKFLTMTEDGWFPISAHGHYQFQVSDAATGENARTIDLP